jgi:hypothetical protein
MSGSVKLDCAGHLIVLENSVTHTSDSESPNFSAIGAIRGIVTTQWSGYDGTTDGKVFLQLCEFDSNDDSEWDRWGQQGDLNAATGKCIFHIWRGAPGFVRIRYELGDGTTITVSSNYRLGWG